jgi:hypothetical protein
VTYSGPLSVVLAEFSASGLTEAIERVPGFLETLYAVFDTLVLHGYGFAWFDKTAGAGAPRFYYVMKRVMSI